MNRIEKKINKDFFCDGHYYLLTSSNLGESNIKPDKISNELLQNPEGIVELLEKGIAIPLVFPGDCALDQVTTFILGDLNEEEEKNWVGVLSSWLKITSGKFLLLAGGGDPNELENALNLVEQDENYIIYDVFDIPPDNYRVDIYCYIDSTTFECDFDYETLKIFRKPWKHIKEKEEYYKGNFLPIHSKYIINFKPLGNNQIDLPELEEETGWCGTFKYR